MEAERGEMEPGKPQGGTGELIFKEYLIKLETKFSMSQANSKKIFFQRKKGRLGGCPMNLAIPLNGNMQQLSA